MKVKEANIVVVGAGIIGMSIAERLQYEKNQVLVIDRLMPGEGCSKGNAGHFGTDIVLPLANFNTILALPRLLMNPLGPLTISWSYLPRMLPWLLRFVWAAMPHKSAVTSRALTALNKPSIERYEALLKRTGLAHLMIQRGALTVYETAKSIDQEKATLKVLRDYGVTIEELSGDQIREMEPAVSANIKGGLFFPNTAHTINPHKIVTSLAEVFRQQGGEFLQTEVKSLNVQADNSIFISTESETIKAKRIIVAAGAWSRSLVRMLGFSVPLDTERGYHLMLKNSKVGLSRPITSFERSFVMTPMEEGLRLAGTVELAGIKAAPNYQRADILYQHAQNILTNLEMGEVNRWMGFRPSLPDSLPVIGPSPKAKNVFFAFGHQHLGLTQAAMTSDLMADLIAGREPKIDMRPYRVDRFY